MAQRTDLYSILVAYANKNNSPYIGIETFLDFLGRYAKKHSEDQPEWLKWMQDKAVKFWSEMSILVEDNKCELLTDTDDGRVYMPHFYPELLQQSYLNADEEADLPFPSEETRHFTLPENQIKSLNAEFEFLSYLEESGDSDIPIVKLRFPDEFGSALAPAGLIPRQLTEMAILKIRNYLRKGGNKEYALRKLSPQLQSKESALREQLNRVLLRPLECYSAMEDGGEFSYLFWAHFCILIKNDIKKKKERLSEDVAAIQSVYIIEAINGYFKSLAAKRRESELAFKSLENHLARPPYSYTLEQIFKFTSSKGVLLQSQYSKEDLEEWIRKKTTESENNELPVLLIMQGAKDERYFVLKEKILALCIRLLAEVRVQIRDAIFKQWRKMLSEYQTEPAMENDAEFEKTLAKLTERLNPPLANLLADPKLLLVYDEMEQSQNGAPAAVSIFSKGQLLPYSSLYFLKRKEILAEAKLILPFWYSIPILSPIIAMIKNWFKRKKAPKLAPPGTQTGGEDVPGEKDRPGEIRSAAEELELSLVPPGHTLDSYLEELQNRWSRLIDKQARENLTEDVNSLIRDHLRQNLKVQKQFKVTQELIGQMATNIVTRTPTLSPLSGRDSLILYAQLYLIKLLENIK